jgi:hypothetical protein
MTTLPEAGVVCVQNQMSEMLSTAVSLEAKPNESAKA